MTTKTSGPAQKSILLRDSTLREGLEMPGVRLTESDKLRVVQLLLDLGVTAVELIGPSNFDAGLRLMSRLRDLQPVTKSAIVAVGCTDRPERLQRLAEAGVDQVDLLRHVSQARLNSALPASPRLQAERIVKDYERAFREARSVGIQTIGVGFGDVFRTPPQFAVTLAKSTAYLSPAHFVLYDTVGVARPSQVTGLIRLLSKATRTALHCHFHDDLGMATANTVAAIENGAAGADVTIAGFGDRCGNASLEEVVLIAEQFLHLSTGFDLHRLTPVSQSIQELFGVTRRLHNPITGDWAFTHSTPSHYVSLLKRVSAAYEPYPPELVGQVRRFQIDGSSELAVALKEWYELNGFTNVDVNAVLTRHQGQVLSEQQLRDVARWQGWQQA